MNQSFIGINFFIIIVLIIEWVHEMKIKSESYLKFLSVATYNYKLQLITTTMAW
eukprot:m.136561 g.136561  ORF g.136561 m.136561 type:complete len:54 (+) comp10743_c0_seq1:22-183(+)